MNTDSTVVTRTEMEEFFTKMLKERLKEVLEEHVQINEIRLRELSLMERVINVEEELKSLRSMSEYRFEALQREMDKRFEALLREMSSRFEALQREMNSRFESMDKRFTTMQWMIGLFVGIPALTITIYQLVKIF
jgi:ABC-type phosphate transport system auxiliary subunit